MMNMVEYSKYDLERVITLPKFSIDLAEFLGILSGDGYLIERGRIHRIGIVLNLTEDIFYLEYVVNLIEKLFGIKPRIRPREDEHKFEIVINSKVATQYILKLGFPNGAKKDKLSIPPWVLKENNFLTSFLRGVMDTDGSIFFAKRGTYKMNEYPVIEIKMHDKKFIKKLRKSIKFLKFNCNGKKFKIQLNGKENLEKWINKIGVNNFNLLSRYLIRKRLKYCPPNTSLEQRIKILSRGGRMVTPAIRQCAEAKLRRFACRARDCKNNSKFGVQIPASALFIG